MHTCPPEPDEDGWAFLILALVTALSYAIFFGVVGLGSM